MPDLIMGDFTVEELVHHNNRLLDLLSGAEWPVERGMIYILFMIVRAQHLDGVSLEQALEQYKSVWVTAVQFSHGMPDDKLSGNN